MKNFNYSKLLLLGLTIIAIVITTAILLYIFSKQTTIETSYSTIFNTNTKEEILIPNVSDENTKFNTADTTKKIQTFNISASTRLTDYNLYYCINFSPNIKQQINDEDFLIFNDLILILEENCTILFKYELNGNYSKDAYEFNISNIEEAKSEIPETEEVPQEVLNKENLNKDNLNKKENTKNTSPYFIKVNYKANVVTIYTKDTNGNYTVPYKAMICSCGKYTPTSGIYKTSDKYVWRPLINNVYGHYATRIVNKILFHSVPYTSPNNDALEYWEYDKLGQTASAGCIRLTVKDAKWIYNNCPSGTMVEFYADSTPGPLGKPTAQKISSNEECRNWDPTDPKEGNPWHTYKEVKTTSANTNNNEPITDAITSSEPFNNDTNVDISSSNETSTNNTNSDTPSNNESSPNDAGTDEHLTTNESVIDLSPKNELITEPILGNNILY